MPYRAGPLTAFAADAADALAVAVPAAVALAAAVWLSVWAYRAYARPALAARADRAEAGALRKLLLSGPGARSRVEASFARLLEHLRREKAAGAGVQPGAVPVVEYADVAAGRVPRGTADRIRRRGVVVVRGVVGAGQARSWRAALERYVADNAAAGFPPGSPQIFDVFYSRPQVEARQHPGVAAVAGFLGGLWSPGRRSGVFDPTRQCTYVDRARIRRRGDESLRLGAHVDNGAGERWRTEAGRRCYADIIDGRWEDFDPWDATHRAGRDSYGADPSPERSSGTAFRTFQGWLSLSEQGPDDGTLEVCPLAREGVAYLVLRALLGGAGAGSARGGSLHLTPEEHPHLLELMTPIPRVGPGDYVAWHPDLVHGVSARRAGDAADDAAALYVPCAPLCPRNCARLPAQKRAFLSGLAPPDFFAGGRGEVSFAGRATVHDLSPLGRQQMGFQTWGARAGDDAGRAAELLDRCNAIAMGWDGDGDGDGGDGDA